MHPDLAISLIGMKRRKSDPPDGPFYGDSLCIPGSSQHEFRYDPQTLNWKRQCECGETWHDPDDIEWNGIGELN